MEGRPLLELRGVCKYFRAAQGAFRAYSAEVRALEGVSLALEPFKTLGIVGESGSGKTTLAKVILKLIAPTRGEVLFNEQAISNFRKDVQIIFQNPYNSLDPSMRVGDTLAEPLLIHRIVPRRLLKARIEELLEMVGMDGSAMGRYPSEFSGGQRQRICIARALASGPKLLVLDEPVSSLDLTIQARLLDLFLSLKERLKLTYVFISHNLALIKKVADSVAVMCAGSIVEEGSVSDIFDRPCSEYTRALLKAARFYDTL